jgi:hypothetical protein
VYAAPITLLELPLTLVADDADGGLGCQSPLATARSARWLGPGEQRRRILSSKLMWAGLTCLVSCDDRLEGDGCLERVPPTNTTCGRRLWQERSSGARVEVTTVQ